MLNYKCFYFINPKCIVIGMAANKAQTIIENQIPAFLMIGVYFL
jgi:hypothetical protein